MKRWSVWYPLVVSALLLVPACGPSRGAAQSALSAAESAYAKIAEQATNLSPDEAHAIEASLAAARASLARGEYKSVVTAAAELEARIKLLADGLPALAAKLQADWQSLAESVPGSLATVQRKLDAFGQPPSGAPGRAAYDSAAARIAVANQQWDEARTLAAGGKLAQAIALGEQVRAGMVAVLDLLQVGS